MLAKYGTEEIAYASSRVKEILKFAFCLITIELRTRQEFFGCIIDAIVDDWLVTFYISAKQSCWILLTCGVQARSHDHVSLC